MLRIGAGKMKSTRKSALYLSSLLALTGVAILVPRPAHAVCCVAYDYSDAHSTSSKAVSSIDQHFDQSLQTTENQIVEAMRQFSGQMTANSQAATTAASQMADVHDQREVMRRIQDQRVRATNAAISGASVCNVLTGVIAGQNLPAQTAVYRRMATQAQISYDAGIDAQGNAMDRDAAIAVRQNAHCAAHATAEDVKSGYCKTVTEQTNDSSQSTSQSTPAVSADLNANTLMKSTTLSSDDQTAATEFLVTTLTPHPLGALPSGYGKTVEGRRIIAERQTAIGRNSVADMVGSGMYAERVAFKDAASVDSDKGQSTSLDDWSEATAEATLGYSKDAATGKYFPNGISKLGWLELRAKGWYMNPKWGAQLDSQGADQTAKDQAEIAAFSVYQNYEEYRLLEEINLSLATVVSILQDDHRSKL